MIFCFPSTYFFQVPGVCFLGFMGSRLPSPKRRSSFWPLDKTRCPKPIVVGIDANQTSLDDPIRREGRGLGRGIAVVPVGDFYSSYIYIYLHIDLLKYKEYFYMFLFIFSCIFEKNTGLTTILRGWSLRCFPSILSKFKVTGLQRDLISLNMISGCCRLMKEQIPSIFSSSAGWPW